MNRKKKIGSVLVATSVWTGCAVDVTPPDTTAGSAQSQVQSGAPEAVGEPAPIPPPPIESTDGTVAIGVIIEPTDPESTEAIGVIIEPTDPESTEAVVLIVPPEAIGEPAPGPEGMGGAGPEVFRGGEVIGVIVPPEAIGEPAPPPEEPQRFGPGSEAIGVIIPPEAVGEPAPPPEEPQRFGPEEFFPGGEVVGVILCPEDDEDSSDPHCFDGE